MRQNRSFPSNYKGEHNATINATGIGDITKQTEIKHLLCKEKHRFYKCQIEKATTEF